MKTKIIFLIATFTVLICFKNENAIKQNISSHNTDEMADSNKAQYVKNENYFNYNLKKID